MLIRLRLFSKLMRLHQPTGIWLLLWPCWWSIAMASPKSMPDIYLLILFAMGAVIMRGAGCVINDMIDRKIDAQVIRTRNRPLASGELSLFHAFELLSILLVLGVIIISQLNELTMLLGCVFMIPVIIYPFMKRIMRFPQVFLGITFNGGAVIGWAAAANEVPVAAWALYAACFFWTLGYDTIYAHQDKVSDKKIGVNSSALLLGEKTKSYLSIFYLIMIVLLVLAGTLHDHHLLYYISLIVALTHMTWQIVRVDLNDASSCMAKFKSNMYFGWIIFAGILLDRILSLQI